MRLLLDTHALIWFLEDAPSLGAAARSAIGSVNHVKYVSHASAWEAAVKVSLGKLRLPVPYEELFPGRLEAMGFEMLGDQSRPLPRLVDDAVASSRPF